MNSLWNIDLDTYIEVMELAQANGKKPGDSMQEEFLEIMKKKEIKPLGHSELNKEELIQEYISKDKKVLDISIDDKGKSSYKIFKKLDSQ